MSTKKAASYIYPVLIENIEVKLLRIKNIDELYNELIQKDPSHEDVKDERIPYWAELWPSAIALAKHIVIKKNSIKSTNVLEIGCGLGLPGIIAGIIGANVTMSDYLTDALDFAKKNWDLNISNKKATFKLIDWRNIDTSLATDIVLASDVAYEKRAFEPLLNAFKTLLKPGGVILMSEPSRVLANPFFEQLKLNGFVFTTSCYEIELNQLINKINVHEIKLTEKLCCEFYINEKQ